MSASLTVSYGQSEPIIGLTLEQKRQLAFIKLDYPLQKNLVEQYRKELAELTRVNLSLTEIQRLQKQEVINLREIVTRQSNDIQLLETRLELAEQPKTQWWVIVLTLIVGIGGGVLIAI